MKRYTSWLILVTLLFAVSVLAASQGNDQAKYKVVEVKHLTKAEGIDVPAEYLNGAYDRLRQDLAKMGIFATVVEDGSTIADSNAVVLECKIIKFHDSGAFGSPGHAQFEVTLSSRGDHRQIQQFITREVAINGGNWGNKARATGANLAGEIKRNLK